MIDIVTEVSDDGVVLIVLKGRMKLNDLEEIHERLISLVKFERFVIVDLFAVEYLFSMCLRSLIMCAQSVQSRGGCLALVAPTDNIQAVLNASGAATLMPCFRDRIEAVNMVLGKSAV